MKYKQFLLEKISKLEELAGTYDIGEKLMADIDNTTQEINDFSILIPLIGGFNAGKSSLLNAFLGEELLPTNLLPETAIATEIKYGQKREIVAHNKAGETQVFSVEDIKEISPKEYTHIELFLPNEKLRELGALTLVDMPGVDSTIEDHNQAILHYIKQGVYYVVVTDVNYGLKDSVLDFLQELDLYEINYSVVLSKIDHRRPEEAEKMRDHVISVVDSVTDEDVFVGQVSAKKNNIEDFRNILNNMNQEKLMELHQTPNLLHLGDRVIRELEIRKNHHHLDTDEIDLKIKELERLLADINQQIDQERKMIEQKFGQNTVNRITADVEEAISDNMFQLVKAAKTDEDSFNRALNSIIRPILIKSVDINVQEVLQESAINISSKLDDLGETFKLRLGSFKDHKDGLTTFVEKISNPKFRTLVGGLAIVTSVIAPVIELVIFFIPDILKLFSNQDQKIQDQIEHEIIPQIVTKLEPEITTALDNVKEEFLAEMKEEIEAHKQEILAALTKAKADKHDVMEDGEAEEGRLQQAIEAVVEWKSTVEMGLKTSGHMG